MLLSEAAIVIVTLSFQMCRIGKYLHANVKQAFFFVFPSASFRLPSNQKPLDKHFQSLILNKLL